MAADPGKSATGGAKEDVAEKDSDDSKKKKKKKPGFLTRLLTEPAPTAADGKDSGDSDEQSPSSPGADAAEDDLAAQQGDDAKDEAEAKPKKKKLGFLARLLTEPIAASDDANDAATSDQPRGAPAQGAAPAATNKKRSDRSDDKEKQLTTEAFEAKLEELINQHGKVLAGNVQFVDLSDTKSKFPDRSVALMETLHAVAEQVIRSHLTYGDIYARLKDSHLIIFSDLDPAEAQRRCVQITTEISATLVTQGVDTSGIVAKSIVGEVKGRAELEELSLEDAPPEPTGETDAVEPKPTQANIRT